MNRTHTYDSRWESLGAPLAAEAVPTTTNNQYSLAKILGIWAAAALPMAFLGWVAAPLLESRVDMGLGKENNSAFTRAAFLAVGLIWQFVLAMIIIGREEGDLRWSTIRRRCWLTKPHDPRSGRIRGKLFLWLIPFAILVAAIQMSPLHSVWEAAFPFLGEPEKYSLTTLMESDERKAAIEGAWHVLILFTVIGIFNTILGEELLFRGILLPRMQGTFGRWDWLANGVLFGLYHLHQPWTILGSTLEGVFCLAFPSKRFRSAWFGIILHSAQTVFFVVAALGLVLGLA